MSIPLDLIIRNGIVVTASDQVPCDIGIRDGKIVLLMVGIPPQEGVEEIDAEGGCVTPGGVDRCALLSPFPSFIFLFLRPLVGYGNNC